MKILITIVASCMVVSTFAVTAPQLWCDYISFADKRWSPPPSVSLAGVVGKELVRKKYFSDHFEGKQVTITGLFDKSDKATWGGTYVSVKVGDKKVKVMARPNEKEKIASFNSGGMITFTATFKSRGDATHCATFEDGVFAVGDSIPKAAADQVGDETMDSGAWKEFCKFSNDKKPEGRGILDWSKEREKIFAEKFYGKRIRITGTYKSAGKAVSGGHYVSLQVDGVNVKSIVRPCEWEKCEKLKAGDAITISATFKSTGDMKHAVTFEDGVLHQ